MAFAFDFGCSFAELFILHVLSVFARVARRGARKKPPKPGNDPLEVVHHRTCFCGAKSRNLEPPFPSSPPDPCWSFLPARVPISLTWTRTLIL